MRSYPKPWHAAGAEFFHFCLDCETGRAALQWGSRQWGTGGKAPCRDCRDLQKRGFCYDLEQAESAIRWSPEEGDA